MLQYGAAVQSLERRLALSQTNDRGDLKKLALLKEYAAKWQKLMLDPSRLKELGNFLIAQLSHVECDHTSSLTRRWLAEKGVEDLDQVLKALANYGGYCDCEILSNVIQS